MGRLQEYLEQLAPKLPEQLTNQAEDYSHLPELTEEETADVILQARKKKFDDEEAAKYAKDYWQRLTAQATPKFYTAEELRNRLMLSRTANGKRYLIDEDNQGQVNTLCLYFSGDPRLEEYGFSHSKGLLLMGGLGVGKTHLMSFFFQNQKASYVMTPCRQIEDRWVNTNMKDQEPVNWIEHYSQPIKGAVNGNPYGHQDLGICLDDLGTETIPSKRFGEEKNVIAEIILARYDRRMMAINNQTEFPVTHTTTNLNGQKLKELYGDRIGDRLKEMCNVIVFPDSAKSRR